MFTAGFDSKNRGGRQSGAGLQVRGGECGELVRSIAGLAPGSRLVGDDCLRNRDPLFSDSSSAR